MWAMMLEQWDKGAQQSMNSGRTWILVGVGHPGCNLLLLELILERDPFKGHFCCFTWCHVGMHVLCMQRSHPNTHHALLTDLLTLSDAYSATTEAHPLRFHGRTFLKLNQLLPSRIWQANGAVIQFGQVGFKAWYVIEQRCCGFPSGLSLRPILLCMQSTVEGLSLDLHGFKTAKAFLRDQ